MDKQPDNPSTAVPSPSPKEASGRTPSASEGGGSTSDARFERPDLGAGLSELNSLSPIQKEATRLRRLAEVVQLISRDLVFRSPLPRMAAALAFRTIFGLIPIVVLGLVVLGEVISDEQLEAEISRLLDFAGISQIVSEDRTRSVEEALEADLAKAGASGDPADTPKTRFDRHDQTGDGTPADSPIEPGSTDSGLAESGLTNSSLTDTSLTDTSLTDLSRADPGRSGPGDTGDTVSGAPGSAGSSESAVSSSVVDAGAPVEGEAVPADLEVWIKELIQRVRDVSLRAVGFVGALVLIYAAFTLIREIERSFNQIYGATAGRSWLSSVFVYWTTITLGGLLLVGTFYAGDWLAHQLAEGIVGRGAIEVGITTFITMALLTLAYIGLPNTRVDLRAAIGGAFVATLLWLALKSGFRLYLQAATGYERLYGEIGLIPLFLFWVYLTWLVVLFGLQVSYAFQTFSVWRERTLRARSTRVDFVDPTALIGVAATLARRFTRGDPATIGELARSVGIGEGAAADLVDLLTDAGVATRLLDEGEDARYQLARPAESIGTVDLLRLTEMLTTTDAAATGAAVVAKLRTALHRQWDGTSLADLMTTDPASKTASR